MVLVTRNGQAIRFPETEISPMGRAARGVKGMRLRKGDEVVGMVVVRREATLCTVTEQGYAKRTPVADYPVQRRGGLGSVTLKVTKGTGALVAAKELVPGDELMILTAGGRATRVAAGDVPVQGRTTQGRQLITPVRGDRVIEVARVAADRGEERGDGKRAPADGDQLELVAAAGE